MGSVQVMLDGPHRYLQFGTRVLNPFRAAKHVPCIVFKYFLPENVRLGLFV